MTEKIVALATASPPPPHRVNAEVPIAMSQLIQDMLAKTPNQRPANATAVASRLAAIERAMAPPPEKTADIPIAAPVSPRRRNRLLVALAAALVVIGGGLLTMQQIRVTTPKGTLVIDTDDPNVEVIVKKNGAVLRDKLKDREILLEVGDYTIELTEKKDGLKLSTNKFSITRDGKETVKVWLEKPPPEPVPADLQRKVLEWVLKQDRSQAFAFLSTGSSVWLKPGDSIPKDFAAIRHFIINLPNPEAISAQVGTWLEALPAETWIELWLESKDWNDEALGRLVVRLQEARNLHLRIMSPTSVTDQGLKHLLTLGHLREIALLDLKVSDAAVRELEKLPPLDHLCLNAVPITDKTVDSLLRRGKCSNLVLQGTDATVACLPAILRNTNLQVLFLRGFALRDDDLRKLAALKQLHSLGIGGPHLMNESLRPLAELPFLKELEIMRECEQIDDKLFDELNVLGPLTVLVLRGNAKITDAGLAKVKNLPNLTRLNLSESTAITADGVAKLRAAMPKLKVEWDGDAKK
jgi:hypothetical protein